MTDNDPRGRGERDASPSIAIMQGRLSPPVNGQLQSFPARTWAAEFQRAHDAGLDAIEWIFDAVDNPILAEGAADGITTLCQDTGVGVRSICADYFMDAPLHRGSVAEIQQRAAVLRALIDRARQLGAGHIVLPCVDQSAIVDQADRDRLVAVLGEVNPHAESRDVELHLETSLGPNDFATLLAKLPATVKANYDSGNSASLGYDVREEFASYGARVGSVHIKDRVRGGGSVALGSGNADFRALFEALDRLRYRRLFTLQVARGQEGREVELARDHRAFVVSQLHQAAARR